MPNEYLAWLERAKYDIESADLLIREQGHPDIFIYLIHLSLEKLLKGYLLKFGQSPPRVHYLVDLKDLLLPYVPNLNLVNSQITGIDQYYPKLRYPTGDQLSEMDALESRDWYAQVFMVLVET